MSRTHEHRWEPERKEDTLIFEDGAAIFHEVCRWQPTKAHHDHARDEIYHEPKGPECGEERRIRFDATYIKRHDGKFFPIPEDPAEMDETTERICERIETNLTTDGDTDVVEVDPDPDTGRVVVEYEDYRLVYAPDPEAVREMYHEKEAN